MTVTSPSHPQWKQRRVVTVISVSLIRSEYRFGILRRVHEFGRFVGRESGVPDFATEQGDTAVAVSVGKGDAVYVDIPIVAVVKNDFGVGVEVGSQFPELPEC